MKRVEEILKKKEEINEYGVKTIKQLIKSYKKLESGREFDIEYIYTNKYENNAFGGEYKSFKKLANAEKYVEGIF